MTIWQAGERWRFAVFESTIHHDPGLDIPQHE